MFVGLDLIRRIRMESVGGLIGGCGSSPPFYYSSSSSSSSSSWSRMKGNKKNNNNHKFRVSCIFSSSPADVVSDPYRTLRIPRGSSESEVKKAFRQLALKYLPDVCRGSDCGVQFHQINQAYDMVMNKLREEEEEEEMEEMYGDPDDMWEGVGIRDYSSHINPYI